MVRDYQLHSRVRYTPSEETNPMSTPATSQNRPATHYDFGHIYVRLAEVCRDRGLTHQGGPHKGKTNLMALADSTGVAYTTLIAIVNYPTSMKALTFDTIARLCTVLQCDPGDLLEYRQGKPPSTQLTTTSRVGRAPKGHWRQPKKPALVAPPAPVEPPPPEAEVPSKWD